MSELRWCVMQDGYPVASGFGPKDRAIAEMMHYAVVYGEDGPVEMRVRTAGSNWKPYVGEDNRE